MPSRISEIADSLRQIGEIQVSDFDLKGLLHKDIKDLEIVPSLRKLGNQKVMDWDFRTALPKVHELAYREVDLVALVKRAAHYKVVDWDFRHIADGDEAEPPPAAGTVDPERMQELIGRLKSFLHFVTASLIDEADRAQIRIQEIEPGVLRFKIVVTSGDLKTLLGRDGLTASSIRNLLKAAARAQGVHALLQILSHEEDVAQGLREAGTR